MGVLVLLLLVVLVTGGKQSQLLVRLTWTGMDLDWSLTKYGYDCALKQAQTFEKSPRIVTFINQ